MLELYRLRHIMLQDNNFKKILLLLNYAEFGCLL
jgi:hypothetical protein